VKSYLHRFHSFLHSIQGVGFLDVVCWIAFFNIICIVHVVQLFVRDPTERLPPSTHLRTEADPVSFVFQNTGQWTSAKSSKCSFEFFPI
jgi:hypothetical protein